MEKIYSKFEANRMNGSMTFDVPKLACLALEERKKGRRKKEKLLAQNSQIENVISPEPFRISTRSKRLYVPLVEFYTQMKLLVRGANHGLRISTGKSGLGRF